MDASLMFVGTATTVLRLGPFTLLTDPNFLHRGERAHLGYGLVSRRQTEPALGIDQLPPLDAVLLSHLHGDHFDAVAKRELDHALPVITTGHACRRLRAWGFEQSVGLRTWEEHVLTRDGQRLRITSVPAQHGPAVVHRLLPPVMGSVVDLENAEGHRTLRLYITGDTLCRPMLEQIRSRFSGVDVMIAHLGGTRVLGVLVTMDARQGLELVSMIEPGCTVPVHYDDYSVFRSPLTHFLAEAHRRHPDVRIDPVLRGQTIELTSTVRRGNPGELM